VDALREVRCGGTKGGMVDCQNRAGVGWGGEVKLGWSEVVEV